MVWVRLCVKRLGDSSDSSFHLLIIIIIIVIVSVMRKRTSGSSGNEGCGLMVSAEICCYLYLLSAERCLKLSN